jgi:hypothetical protein
MRAIRTVLFVLVVSFSIIRVEAGAIYKIIGLESYEELELIFEDGKVFGQARPLRGYRSPSTIDVTGTNPTDGWLELTFHSDSVQRVAFKRTFYGDNIRWTSIHDANLFFWRPRRGELSAADLTLSVSGCGPMYKILAIIFSDDASESKLAALLSSEPGLAKLRVAFHHFPQPNDLSTYVSRSATLGNALREMLSLFLSNPEYRTLRRDSRNEIEVPIGAEVTVAAGLRRSGLFNHVDLGSGGCGGANVSFFAVDGSLLFDEGTFSKRKFETFMGQGLRAFASRDKAGRAWDYRIGSATVDDLPVPPYSSSYKVKLRVASELSRQVQGAWDSFEAAFDPADLVGVTFPEYAVVLTIKNLKSVNRRSGQKIQYKFVDHHQATAEVTTALLFSLSRRAKGGWCYYSAEGADETKIRCDK